MCYKKVLLLFFALGVNVSGFSGSDREKRISQLEKQMMEIGAYNRNQSFGAVFGPTKSSKSLGEVFLDLLVYKATVGQTEIRCRSLDRYEDGKESLPHNKIETLSFDWTLGFRVGASKEGVYQDCCLSTDYTYFKTKGKEGHRGDLPTALAFISSDIKPQMGVYSSYSLSYQNINLDVSKGYFLSENILFYSFAGLKGSLLSQKQISESLLSVKAPTLLSHKALLDDRCKFYGIGPRVGFFSRWYIFKEFSFLTKCAGSLLYGFYKLHDGYQGHEVFFEADQKKEDKSKIDIKKNFHSFCPFVETTLGLSWNKSFRRERLVLTLAAGYEILFFWRQSKSLVGEGILYKEISEMDLRPISFSRKCEDVALSGLVLEIQLDF